ncbi:MAG: hypothetical protein INQ03_07805 [Candidatus Heimdallarchaeota archaeon]|nr:hypothetical protein [Candidatus Heimdallarchaeota archaeon]
MVEYVPFEEGIEVNGATVMSVVDGMGSFKKMALSYLGEAGLTDVVGDTEHWYSQKDWLQAFKRISEKIGTNTLNNIGKKIPENAVFPPEVDNIVAGLGAIDVAYHMNHRNKAGEVLFNPENGEIKEGIGNYIMEKTGEKQVKVTCKNPYPCDFDKGIVHAMARRFEPYSNIIHDEGQCRKHGKDACTFTVTW